MGVCDPLIGGFSFHSWVAIMRVPIGLQGSGGFRFHSRNPGHERPIWLYESVWPPDWEGSPLALRSPLGEHLFGSGTYERPIGLKGVCETPIGGLPSSRSSKVSPGWPCGVIKGCMVAWQGDLPLASLTWVHILMILLPLYITRSFLMRRMEWGLATHVLSFASEKKNCNNCRNKLK